MTNFSNYKNECYSTIKELKRALKLKKEANKLNEQIKALIKGSYIDETYYHCKEFTNSELTENAIKTLANITYSYGLRTLYNNMRGYSGSYYDFIKNYFIKLKIIKNYTIENILNDCIGYIRTDKDWRYSNYELNKNKIKYISSSSSSYFFETFLNCIQLYEISINSDITDKETVEKLSKIKNDIDTIQYKNIKIQCYKNGNFEITFADDEELKKVWQNIQNIIKLREEKKA